MCIGSVLPLAMFAQPILQFSCGSLALPRKLSRFWRGINVVFVTLSLQFQLSAFGDKVKWPYNIK